MTKAEALKALTGMGMTRKVAAFLLDSAEKHGAGAHLKCDVTYAEGLGYAIVDYSASRGGTMVDPCSGGYACDRPGCIVTIRHGHGGR